MDCAILIELQDLRMVWVGRHLKDHLVPTPLPWTGTPSTTSGYSQSHPAWPSTLPGMIHNSGQPVLVQHFQGWSTTLDNLFWCLTTCTV